VLHEGTDPWYVQSVLVTNTSTGASGLFPCAKLIQGGVPMVLDAVELPPCDYKVGGSLMMVGRCYSACWMPWVAY
jgi:hypothetical protein